MVSTNMWLKVIAGIHINAVLFGMGAILVLAVPSLAAHAKYLIPLVIVLSFGLTPLLAGWIAARMRIRNWGREEWRRGDLISG